MIAEMCCFCENTSYGAYAPDEPERAKQRVDIGIRMVASLFTSVVRYIDIITAEFGVLSCTTILPALSPLDGDFP